MHGHQGCSAAVMVAMSMVLDPSNGLSLNVHVYDPVKDPTGPAPKVAISEQDPQGYRKEHTGLKRFKT